MRSVRGFQGNGEGEGLARAIGALERALKSPSCGCHPNDTAVSGYCSFPVSHQAL